MLQELRDSDRQIGEMQNLRKEKLLHDMARGRVDSHTDKRLEELGLSVRRCSFMLVVYSVDQIDLHLSSLPDEDAEDDRTSLDLIDLVISRVAGSFQPTGCTTHLFSIDNMIACLLLAEETRLESEQSVKEYLDIMDHRKTEQLIDTLDKVEQNRKECYIREFSIEHFHDSKVFETLIPKICKIFREENEELTGFGISVSNTLLS